MGNPRYSLKPADGKVYVGAVVIYRHEDGKNYPAVVSEIEREQLGGGMENFRCMLTVLRPRAIDWKWGEEGEARKEWFWPEVEFDMVTEGEGK